MFSFWSGWSLGKRGTATLSFGPLVRDEIVLADGAGDDALLITNALCVLFGGRALVGGGIPVDVRLDFTGGLYRSSSLARCYTNRDYNVVTYDRITEHQDCICSMLCLVFLSSNICACLIHSSYREIGDVVWPYMLDMAKVDGT